MILAVVYLLLTLVDGVKASARVFFCEVFLLLNPLDTGLIISLMIISWQPLRRNRGIILSIRLPKLHKLLKRGPSLPPPPGQLKPNPCPIRLRLTPILRPRLVPVLEPSPIRRLIPTAVLSAGDLPRVLAIRFLVIFVPILEADPNPAQLEPGLAVAGGC